MDTLPLSPITRHTHMVTVCASNAAASALLIARLIDELGTIPLTSTEVERRRLLIAAAADWNAGRFDLMAERMAAADRMRDAVPVDLVRPTFQRPTIGYDPETKLVWGVGANQPVCMAVAGAALVKAGKTELMAHLRWQRATPGFAEAHEVYGPDIPWSVNLAGLATPDAGYGVQGMARAGLRVVPIPIRKAGNC